MKGEEDMPDYFVDCHCHLFNIEDIPLYATISRVKDLPNSLLALVALFGAHKTLLKIRKIFIDYFDKRRFENVQWISKGAAVAIGANASLRGRQIIITPLVMDFDKIGGGPPVSWESVTYQTSRLRNAISQAKLPDGVKMLPFVGLDLRKVSETNDVATLFDALLDSCGGMKSGQDRQDVEALESGDIIGVKLYPPIGFNPFSDTSNDRIDPKRKRFYDICIERKIPITVHCQSVSYFGSDVNQKKVNRNTNPKNWAKVLETVDSDNMRINFAHCGGEKAIKEMVLPKIDNQTVGRPGPNKKFRKGTWGQVLMCLLKQYPNTYADISAYDFMDSDAVIAMAWLLVLDEAGELEKRLGIEPQKYKLKDKLLWGTDIPMILGKKDQSFFGVDIHTGYVETYKDYLDCFLKAVNIPGLRSYKYAKPKKSDYPIPSSDGLVECMTHRNPMRFLFGHEA